MVELLVASTIAMILMVSVYTVYTISTRGYRVQQQFMGAMQQARFAMGQLQRDISAAGFLATPMSTADNSVCPKPVTNLPGLAIVKGGAVGEPTLNVKVAPQQITLFGAFWSPRIYFTQSVAGNVVTFQGGDLASGWPQTAAEFQRIFEPGRFLRLVNADQFEMYIAISARTFIPAAGANPPGGTVTLASPVPVASPPDFCGVQGFGVGLEANVAGYVRYLLVADPSEPAKVDLVRQELDGSDGTLATVMAKSTIRVAEYVADLQFYDFAMDVDSTGRRPTIGVYPTLEGDTPAGLAPLVLDVTAGARPQDLRFVTVKLTTRTQDEDESFRFVPRTDVDVPLDTYEVDPDMAGAAHTVSLAARIGFPSFQVRNVK
jgi:hypothetical protein